MEKYGLEFIRLGCVGLATLAVLFMENNAVLWAAGFLIVLVVMYWRVFWKDYRLVRHNRYFFLSLIGYVGVALLARHVFPYMRSFVLVLSLVILAIYANYLMGLRERSSNHV